MQHCPCSIVSASVEMTTLVLMSDGSAGEFDIVSVTDERGELVAQAWCRHSDLCQSLRYPGERASTSDIIETLACCLSLLSCPLIFETRQSCLDAVFVYDNLACLQPSEEATSTKTIHQISMLGQAFFLCLKGLLQTYQNKLVDEFGAIGCHLPAKSLRCMHASVANQPAHINRSDWAPGIANTKLKNRMKQENATPSPWLTQFGHLNAALLGEEMVLQRMSCPRSYAFFNRGRRLVVVLYYIHASLLA